MFHSLIFYVIHNSDVILVGSSHRPYSDTHIPLELDGERYVDIYPTEFILPSNAKRIVYQGPAYFFVV